MVQVFSDKNPVWINCDHCIACITGSSASGSTSKRRKKEQRQLMISLITIFVAFVLTWIPFGTLVFLFGYDLSYVTTTPFGQYLSQSVLIVAALQLKVSSVRLDSYSFSMLVAKETLRQPFAKPSSVHSRFVFCI